eukprot:6033899-Alexandrium_andersonii.AAC.1
MSVPLPARASGVTAIVQSAAESEGDKDRQGSRPGNNTTWTSYSPGRFVDLRGGLFDPGSILVDR